ncbi:MAG: hypothetical protein Q7U01_05350, partial [Pseudomonas sp.]|nr:hypothetical protein [Pseudomonas sp.]
MAPKYFLSAWIQRHSMGGATLNVSATSSAQTIPSSFARSTVTKSFLIQRRGARHWRLLSNHLRLFGR